MYCLDLAQQYSNSNSVGVYRFHHVLYLNHYINKLSSPPVTAIRNIPICNTPSIRDTRERTYESQGSEPTWCIFQTVEVTNPSMLADEVQHVLCKKKRFLWKLISRQSKNFNADIFFFLKGIKFNASWAFNFNGRPKCRSDSETNVLLLVQAAIVPPSMLCAFLNTYLTMQIRNYLWYPLNVKSNLSTDKIEIYFGC